MKEQLLLAIGDTVLWRNTRLDVVGVTSSPDEQDWWPKYRLKDPQYPNDDFSFSQRHVDKACKKLMSQKEGE